MIILLYPTCMLSISTFLQVQVFILIMDGSQIQCSHLSADYSKQLSEQTQQQIKKGVVFIQSEWLDNFNTVIHRVNCSSGFFITPNLILTTAHNIFNKKTAKFANRIEVSYLEKSDSITVFSEKIIMQLTEDNYRCDTIINNGKQTYANDFALIRIHKKHERIQYKCIRILTEIAAIEKNARVFVSGFPDFKSEQSKRFKHKKRENITLQTLTCLKEDIGKFQKIENNSIFYQIKTVIGQSGSPIFIKDKDKGVILAGVHNSYNNQNRLGRGLLFNRQNLSILTRWIEELTPELNEETVTRLFVHSLDSFCDYQEKMANKLSSMLAHHSSQLGSKFRQTKQKWEHFWSQLDSFKEQMHNLYNQCKKIFEKFQQQQIEHDDFKSENSSLEACLTDYYPTTHGEQTTSFFNDRRCASHQETGYYLFSNLKKIEESLCNRCIFFNPRLLKDVQCRLHRQKIRFAQIDEHGEAEVLQLKQVYLCNLCEKVPIIYNKEIVYRRIDKQHHRSVSYAKLLTSKQILRKRSRLKPINLESLLLCDLCVGQKTAEQLEKQGIIEIAEPQLQKLMYKGNEYKKEIGDRLKRIQEILSYMSYENSSLHNIDIQRACLFFEAFEDMLFCNSRQLVSSLFDITSTDQQCERIITKLSIMKVNQFSKRSPVELLKLIQSNADYLENTINSWLIKRNLEIEKIGKKMELLILSKQMVSKRKRKIKYSTIVNKKRYDLTEIKPCEVNSIISIDYSSIRNIFVLKPYENEYEASRKEKRLAFFRKQWDNELQKQKNCHNASQINEFLFQEELKFQRRGEDYRNIILQRVQSFPNLEKLTLIYHRHKTNYQDYDYEIESINLLELLMRQNIKMIQLYGIRINHMIEMIQELYSNQSKYASLIHKIKSKNITLHIKTKIELNTEARRNAFMFFVNLFNRIVNFDLVLGGTFQPCRHTNNAIARQHQEQKQKILSQMRTSLLNFNLQAQKTPSQIFSLPFPKNKQIIDKMERINLQLHKLSYIDLITEEIQPKINSFFLQKVKIDRKARDFIIHLLKKKAVFNQQGKKLWSNTLLYLSINCCIIDQHFTQYIHKDIVQISYKDTSMTQGQLAALLNDKESIIQLKLEDLPLRKSSQMYEDLSFKSFKRITHLHIVNCGWLTDHILATLPEKSYETIESLRLARCNNITSGLITTIKNFKQLSRLDISYTSFDLSYLKLLQTKILTHLQINGCESADYETLKKIDSIWPQITTLHILDCCSLTDTIFEPDSFKSLERLSFELKKLGKERLKELRMRAVELISPQMYNDSM